MKREILASILLILILAACSAPSQTPTAPTEVSLQQAAKVTPTTQENTPTPMVQASATSPATEAVPSTPYPVPGEPTAYPAPGDPTPNSAAYPAPEIPNPIAATSRYGIAKVDAVLDALLSGNRDAIPPLLAYTRAPCTKMEGLGGPPKCQGDEVEGTSLDVLPTIGPEGSFLRKDDANLKELPGYVELLGVFNVKADFKSEQYYPAGKFCIVLHVKDSPSIIGLRISDDGIVRVDYFQSMPDPAIQPDLDAYLTPKN